MRNQKLFVELGEACVTVTQGATDPVETLTIEFNSDSSQWSGTFADLQHALKVAKGMKDFEESSPIARTASTQADQRDPETKVFSAMQEGAEDWDNRP